MRVAIVDPSNQTVPYVDYLGQALAEANHTVSLWCSRFTYGTGRPPIAQSVELREQFYRISSKFRPVALRRIGKLVEHSFDMLKVRSAMKAWTPDVIHFQQTPIPLFDSYLIHMFKGLAPIVFTVHNPVAMHGEYPLLGSRYSSFVSKFDHLITHTDSALQRFESKFPASAPTTCTIRPGVYSHYSGKQSSKEIPELTNLDSDTRNVLLFGNIRGYKGYEVAFNGFAKALRSSGLPARLIVAGNPYSTSQRLVDQARELGIEEHVIWIPRYIDDDQVDQVFRIADIVMAPYLDIDLSGILMTALNYPVAFLASNRGSFAEYLIDGEHGRLVDPGDADAVGNALQEMLMTRGELERMQDNVRQHGETWPSWHDVAVSHSRVYEELVGSA